MTSESQVTPSRAGARAAPPGTVWTPGVAAACLHLRGAEGRGWLYLKGLLSSMNQLVPF